MKLLARMAIIASGVLMNPLVAYGTDTYFSTKEKCNYSDNGVYEEGKWLCVIANVSVSNKSQKGFFYEAKTMLLTLKLLKSYAFNISDIPYIKTDKVQGILKDDLDKLTESGEFLDLDINSISTRILINRVIDGKHRRVTMINKEAFISQIHDNLSLYNNDANLINSLLKNAEKKSDYALLSQYYLDLGVLIEAYRFKIKDLGNKYHLVNYPGVEESPFKARQELRKLLAGHSKQYNADLLEKLPANNEILGVINKQINSTDWLGKSLVNMIGMPALDENQKIKQNESFFNALDQINTSSSLNEQISFLKKQVDIGFSTVKLPDVLKTSLNNHGLLIIDEYYNSDPNDYFQKAKSLFDSGRSIDKVIDLLVNSIRISPRHMNSWIYLGSSLKYKNQYLPALSMFQQAIILSDYNIDIYADIADTYLKTNNLHAANAYLYYLELNVNKDSSIYVKKVINEIQQHNKETCKND